MLASIFHPATAAWFEGAFEAPTAAQRAAWPAIAEGAHTLLVAPTGSGKTLSAFLVALDRLLHTPPPADVAGPRVVYLSPLKALAADIERNLTGPLVGIAHVAGRMGTRVHPVAIDVRTGDTPADVRRRQAKSPGDLLVTTPESLYLLLTSAAADTLRDVAVVIVDEVHAILPTKRGVHLQLTLERLAAHTRRDPQRIGLSATVQPLEVAARFLGGDRPVHIADAAAPPDLALEICVPVDDMERPALPATPLAALFQEPAEGRGQAPSNQPRAGLWPAIHPCLVDDIRGHRSTLIFANSRLLCERLTKALGELAGTDILAAHHGSVHHAQRADLEARLKDGTLPALVATSSLELGVDMGAVDLVVLVEAPTSVASALQRVGRAGHQVGATSHAKFYPRFRGDLLACAVVAGAMKAGSIEPVRLPARPLDVLAQQLVAALVRSPATVAELGAWVRRAASYADLPDALLRATLAMLSGGGGVAHLAEVPTWLDWDHATDTVRARPSARLAAVLNAGTIPDRGLFRVRLGADGPFLGELDEEMVYECRAGDVIVLGASSWRIDTIGRDVVHVSAAPGRAGRLPFWRGERPSRPAALGAAQGAFLRGLEPVDPDGLAEHLAAIAPLDARAARNLAAYLTEQRAATGAWPTDRTLVVERFRDALGDWRVCVLSPWGQSVHAPWALAIESALAERTGAVVQATATDDGFTLRFAEGAGDDLPVDVLFPASEEVEDALLLRLRDHALFAGRFRENAARALLLPRRSARGRQPLWAQRRRSEALLAALRDAPSAPMVLETYREILADVFDLPALKALLDGVRDRSVRVVHAETRRASPMARGLTYEVVARWIYEADAPLAERRAAALAVDRDLLASLLGQDLLRDLLDADAIADVDAELQGRAEDRRARSREAMRDLLRRVGDLDDDELAARCEGDVDAWREAAAAARQIIPVRIGGSLRWIAVEDAGWIRDAVGVILPATVPSAHLAPVDDALFRWVQRYARTRGPFLPESLAARYGWPDGVVRAALDVLVVRGALVVGPLLAHHDGDVACDAEVLRRIKRRTLAGLRAEIEPVVADALQAFTLDWHGLGASKPHASGAERLQEVLAQLEGVAVPASALEADLLAPRISGAVGPQLDALGAAGGLVWRGDGAIGRDDGWVRLYTPEGLEHALAEHAPTGVEDPVGQRLLAHLAQRGACFLAELVRAADCDAETASRALFDLVWKGLVTNDTLAPLRAWVAGQRGAKLAGGRWSLLHDRASAPAPNATARALHRATGLLARWGVVSRDHVRYEEIAGGWSALAPVFGQLEDTGRVRRGWFVDGLGSGQFAQPGAVDRLRSARDARGFRWIAAVDPACLWGGVLPWPTPVDAPEAARPRRIPDAQVLLDGGRLLAWLGPAGKHLLRFDDEDATLDALTETLRARLGYRTLALDKVDGVAALEASVAPRLRARGWQADLRRLLLSRG